MDKERPKKWIKLGGWIGGVLSVTVALMQDVLFSDALQGTWFTSIAADLKRFLGVEVSPHSPLVFLLFGIILLILFFIGRIMGMFFALFIYRFMEFLTSGHDRG